MTERKQLKKDVTEKLYAICRAEDKLNFINYNEKYAICRAEDKLDFINYNEKVFYQNYDDALKNFYEYVKLHFLLQYDKDVSKMKKPSEGDLLEYDLCEFERKDKDMILACAATKTYFSSEFSTVLKYVNGFVYSKIMVDTISSKSLIPPVTLINKLDHFLDDVIPKHIIFANELKPKDCVKVSGGGENFWCEFLGFVNYGCVAKINKKLILTEYAEGDIIVFHFSKIMAVKDFDDKFSKVYKEKVIKFLRNSTDYSDIYSKICSDVATKAVALRQLDEIKTKNPPKTKAPSQPIDKESKEERRLRIAKEQEAIKKAKDNKSKQGQKIKKEREDYLASTTGILSPGQKPVITAGGASVSKDLKRKFDDVADSEENQSKKKK